MTIKLIVGLGNPGDKYQLHRHNVGFWFVDALAHAYGGNFKKESKFFGDVAKTTIGGHPVWLLKPNTFMNASGKAIAAMANFYQLSADEVLTVHDELDLSPGTARLKLSGGHGGHNGLRDTIKAIGKDFYRLRIGIGHPGDKSQVSNFVLRAPGQSELDPIQDALVSSLQVIEDVVLGDMEKAMRELHTKEG